MADEIVSLEWRVVERFPSYEVREDGLIRRRLPDRQGRRVGCLIKGTKQYRGHIQITLCDFDGSPTRDYLHRIVAFAFIGNPPSPLHEVAHRDGVPSNNHWRNLRWATRKENSDDRFIHGTMLLGETGTKAILKEPDVLSIRRRFKLGLPAKGLATEYGVCANTIYAITSGRNWKSLP